MQSKIANAYVDISKHSMTEAAKVLRLQVSTQEPEDSKANVAGNITKI